MCMKSILVMVFKCSPFCRLPMFFVLCFFLLTTPHTSLNTHSILIDMLFWSQVTCIYVVLFPHRWLIFKRIGLRSDCFIVKRSALWRNHIYQCFFHHNCFQTKFIDVEAFVMRGGSIAQDHLSRLLSIESPTSMYWSLFSPLQKSSR